MPDLTKQPVPQYTGGQPYHAAYDNLPIEVLAERDFVINGEVDYQSKVLKDAAGTQGNLANRMAQSIEEDGSLKSTAIDESLHNIASHADGEITVDTDELDYYNNTLGYDTVVNPVPFVRMLEAERARLSLIASEATNFSVSVEFPSNITLFNDGTLKLQPSDSIHWEFTAPDIVKPVLTISTDFAHRHYYEIEPTTTDYTNYDFSPYPIVDGSLRVYINGVRLNSQLSVYYPNSDVSAWQLNKFTPDETNGTFVLDSAITSDDIILVDFEVALT